MQLFNRKTAAIKCTAHSFTVDTHAELLLNELCHLDEGQFWGGGQLVEQKVTVSVDELLALAAALLLLAAPVACLHGVLDPSPCSTFVHTVKLSDGLQSDTQHTGANLEGVLDPSPCSTFVHTVKLSDGLQGDTQHTGANLEGVLLVVSVWHHNKAKMSSATSFKTLWRQNFPPVLRRLDQPTS
ncbi:unnamed protein product [Phytophthora lilii]|uniref:Unnamed protein product n=1 Tax=Phytophthora lilii TaxID=2077276 RepID=A0A9W6XHR4_9STRA|nr:unnamed protein product [Phytophthora lilii]